MLQSEIQDLKSAKGYADDWFMQGPRLPKHIRLSPHHPEYD